ncbi:stage II sporulation protein E [Vallitalea okinawensis]|uniref:stage II sporulation protein E n=1 Tax=Vallitalea okinawensis TaxID=2078660 RepID=UPI000CFDD6BF|nr:stage II sporulation protein E [Vallitalea okinawensis]
MQKIIQKMKQISIFDEKGQYIAICILGFFISRVSVYSSLFLFSVAFYSTFLGKKIVNYMLLGTSILGLLSLGNLNLTMRYIIALVLIGAFNGFILYYKKSLSKVGQATVSSILLFLINLVYVLMGGDRNLAFMLAVLECGLNFIMVYVQSYFVYMVGNTQRKTTYKQEELIASVFVLALAVVGTYGIQIGSIQLFLFLSYGLLLLLGYVYGAGVASTVGVVLGIIVNVTIYPNPLLIATFALSGILSGAFRELDKWASALAFTMGNLIFHFYFNNEMIFQEVLIPILLVDFTFMFLPKDLVKHGQIKSRKNELTEKEYMNRVQDITLQRLGTFSDTFQQLAATFEDISEKKMDLSKRDVSKLIDDVADQVCKYCDHIDYCWNKNFYNTYQTIYSILNAADEKGTIEFKDIPESFYKQCYKYKDFIKATNKLYEIYRINLNWYNKVIDSRKIVSNQLEGVSKVMENISRDIRKDISFQTSLEEQIALALEEFTIYPNEVFIYKDHLGSYNMDISLTSVYDNTKIIRKIISVVEEYIGKPCKIDQKSYMDKKNFKLLIKERNLFNVSTGVASRAREELSGDNYTCSEISMGRFLLALSDGMGTGLKANKESLTTIELLEELLMTGFDNSTAIKMINSLLILKSVEESFSTLDIALIDLQTGLCQLIKIGGAMVFIIRKDTIIAYESTSLPVGIVEKIELQTYDFKLHHGDAIIMVTDGIVDALESINKDINLAFKEIMSTINSNNPKVIARKILDKVKHKANQIDDDMTVLVSRIWRERE